jgi:hypothetical protein
VASICHNRLGRDKSIIVAPRDDSARLRSDLVRANVLKYQGDRADGNLVAALGPATASIRQHLSQLQPEADSIPPEMALPIVERKYRLTKQQQEILETIKARDRLTIAELSRLFPKIAVSELFHRLEQLRLLMFISLPLHEGGGHPSSDICELSEPYKRALTKAPARPRTLYTRN